MYQFEIFEAARSGQECPAEAKDGLDDVGHSAAHYAAIHGDQNALQTLKAWGFDVFRASGALIAPFDICLDDGNFQISDWLLDVGEEIEPRPDGKNALDYPAMTGALRQVEFLCEKGAKLDGKLGTRPPIVWAAQEGNMEVFRFLLMAGACPVLSASDGEDDMTALVIISASGDLKAAEMILEVDKEKKFLTEAILQDAAEYAVAFKNPEVAELFRSYGMSG